MLLLFELCRYRLRVHENIDSGPVNWRIRIMPPQNEFFLDSLRAVLQSLGIRTEIQMSSGLSKYAFRALDMVTKLLEWDKPIPHHSAWDLLYTHLYPRDRMLPCPELWWRRMHRQSFGEKLTSQTFTCMTCIHLMPSVCGSNRTVKVS